MAHTSNTLRITGGTARGTRLSVPDYTRPMTERIKLSLFDTLGEVVVGAEVLDLFAGAGSLGIEALSRGAAAATFVDHSPEAVSTIDENLARSGFTSQATVTEIGIKTFLIRNKNKFDIIFIDPPFEREEKLPWGKITNHLNDNGIVIVKQPSKNKLRGLKALNIVHQQKYGANTLYYLRKMAVL